MFDNFFKYFWFHATVATLAGCALFFQGCSTMSLQHKKELIDQVTEARGKVQAARAVVCSKEAEDDMQRLEFILNAVLGGL